MAKNLMILGTASTVGKSIVTAALCRIFKQDGYKVAPFKSQNMALNSYVTKEGLEMGRAQVVQAEAAMIEPHVYMNPILLKPTSDVGSQVILKGKVYKNMKAADYFRFKPDLRPMIMECYEALSNEHDIIFMEGAGSPAEINLKSDDIVNMGMAEMVDAPVVLVGDIDKGGVFAQIYGTYMLLEPSEQARVKGYIINKFRGDVNILQPGLDMFFEKLPIPCLGVIPYMKLAIDDEDSVTERFASHKKNTQSSDQSIRIGIIRLPYMSNFTDFTVFDMEEDVSLSYVQEESLVSYDLLIIPGSKNTIKDMEYLHESGLAYRIKEAHSNKIPVIGICGGYQILGRSIADPFGVETEIKEIQGLGLLNAVTTMSEHKKTVLIHGEIQQMPSLLDKNDRMSTQVEGYEIHMGITELYEGTEPFIILEDGRSDGGINEAGDVFGTYLHGIFDVDGFRIALLNALRAQKGLLAREESDYKAFKENEFNKLADGVRQNLNMDLVKDIIFNA